MQATSSELSAAITAAPSERTRPLVRLKIDWARNGYGADGSLDDLTADVVSVSMSRELATDLPVQAKLFAGQAAATATVTLAHADPAGDPAKHGAWYYSPLNASSPLAPWERKGAPARLEFGFVTVNGPEYLTVLEGFVRSLQVTSGGRVAVLTLEDRSATFRRQVPLPMVVADGTTAAGALLRPGLRTSWIVSHLARQCGWYPQPPPRSSCKFLATMAGSGYPEIGSLVSIEGFEGQQPGFEPTAENPGTAKWVMGMATSTSGDPEARYLLAGSGFPSANNGSTMLVEGWWRWRSTSINQPLWIVFPAGQGHYASVYWKQSTGQLVVTFNRGGGEQNSITGPTVAPGTSSYHYVGVHLSFTSTGVTAIFRYDGTTTGPTTTATASITGTPDFDSIVLDHGRVDSFADAENSVFMEAVQVTTEASPGTWNNGFVPTAEIHTDTTVDTKLLATPPSSDEAWTVLQQVAQAEFATTGFDETGTFTYWPRTRWTTPPYTTSQRTLTPSTGLKELEVTEAIDQARNHIVIHATQVEIQVTQIVWRSVAAHPIPAAGRRLYCAFANPVANLDTSITYGSTGGQSRYLASTARNGAGTARSNLGMVVTAYANHCFIDVDNPNAEQDYLVANSGAVPPGGTQGMPYLILEGQPVLFDQGDNMRAEASSGAADLLLELEASPFRQDLDLVEGVAADLLTDLSDPGPVLSDVPAVGDPRLQLGDRVTIVDAEGLGFTADGHISKIEFEFSPSEGLSMTLALRAA